MKNKFTEKELNGDILKNQPPYATDQSIRFKFQGLLDAIIDHEQRPRKIFYKNYIEFLYDISLKVKDKKNYIDLQIEIVSVTLSALNFYWRESEIWLEQGEAYYNLKKYKKAIKAFEVVTRLNPTDENAYVNLADIYIKLNKFKKAFDIIYKGNKRNPKDTLLLSYMRKLFSKIYNIAYINLNWINDKLPDPESRMSVLYCGEHFTVKEFNKYWKDKQKVKFGDNIQNILLNEDEVQ